MGLELFQFPGALPALRAVIEVRLIRRHAAFWTVAIPTGASWLNASVESLWKMT
jgi:hypothetical protein